jgi:hypothetical protein
MIIHSVRSKTKKLDCLRESHPTQEVDSQGNPLSPEQVKFFKNSKVRDRNGRLLVCTHCTNNEFDTFDKSFIGTSNGMDYGYGFYFSATELDFYGSKQMKCYLDIKNPFFLDVWSEEGREHFYTLLSGFGYDDDIEYYRDGAQRIVDNEGSVEFLDMIIGSEALTNICIKKGYDGIVVGDMEKNEIIAFEPNQIKNITNQSPTNSSNINEDLTLYRVGDVGKGTFFADNLDYYDHSMTDYNKKDAKAYSIDLSSAKVFDPMKDLGWDANTWSDIEGKVKDFEKYNIYYESDEGDTWGHTSTDDIAYAIQKLGYDVLILRDIRGDNGYGPAFNEYVVYNTNLLTPCKEINPTEKELKEDMDKATISIKEFVGLTKPEIRKKIDSLPVDTLITGVRSHSDRSGMDIHIKKTSGYASNYFNPVGSPHDFKNMEVYWTIEGSKHPYIVSDIYEIVTDTNKYYKMTEELKENINEEFKYDLIPGESYYFTKNNKVYQGKFKRKTNAWYFFEDENGNEIVTNTFASISDNRGELENLLGIVDRMAKDTKLPPQVPNRFTRVPNQHNKPMGESNEFKQNYYPKLPVSLKEVERDGDNITYLIVDKNTQSLAELTHYSNSRTNVGCIVHKVFNDNCGLWVGYETPYSPKDVLNIVHRFVSNDYFYESKSNELADRAKKHKKKSKGMGWHMSMNAGNVEKGIEVFNNSTGNVGTGDTGMSMGEAVEKKVYQYIGPVYYKGMLYRERVNLLTKATTRGRALANILYQAADGTELQYFDIEDNLVDEMPDNKETFTCDNCGHPLNDMGQCPACDQGEEELYEDLSSLEALWELSKLDNNV